MRSVVVLLLVNSRNFSDNYNAEAATRAGPGWVGRTGRRFAAPSLNRMSDCGSGVLSRDKSVGAHAAILRLLRQHHRLYDACAKTNY